MVEQSWTVCKERLSHVFFSCIPLSKWDGDSKNSSGRKRSRPHTNENYLFDEQRKEIFVGGFVVKVLQIR